MACQSADAGEIENGRVGERELARERSVEAVAQLHGHQRVHPEIEEADGRLGQARQPQHRLQLCLQERFEQRPAPFVRRAPQAREQIGGRTPLPREPARCRGKHLLQMRCRSREASCVFRPVQGSDDGGGHVLPHDPVKRSKTLPGRDPSDACRSHLPGDARPPLLRPAHARPRAPGDRLARKSLSPAAQREVIEARIRCRVVRLARIAQQASNAREQHEHAQIAAGGRLVQVPRTEYLRHDHPLEPLPALVGQRSVGPRADAVNHSRQRRHISVHPIEHRLDGARVRHVGQFLAHVHPALAQGTDDGRGLLARCAASVQHDRARPSVRQPVRDLPADPAQSSCHQVGPVPPQPPRIGVGRLRRSLRRACRPSLRIHFPVQRRAGGLRPGRGGPAPHESDSVTAATAVSHLRFGIRVQQLVDD